MNQYYYLEEEWDKNILNKFNCCNDELCFNAALSDEALDEPIWLPRTRIVWKKYLPNLIVVMMNCVLLFHRIS